MDTPTIAADVSFADHIHCPACAAPLKDPRTTNYLGLGRIEHEWHCHRCGDAFRTGARMAGLIDAETQPAAPAY
jgi:hypothetical protein